MTEQKAASHVETPIDMGLINDFMEDCKLRGYSPETIRSHRSNLRTIAKFLNNHMLSFTDVGMTVLRDTLDYLKNERKVSQKTLESYFSALSSFYEYLVYMDLHSVNPVPSFRKRYLKTYKKGNVLPRCKLLSVEEMSLLINGALNIRDKAIMAVLAKTGIRRGELLAIDVEDIDWKKNSIKLNRRRKRGNPYVFFDEETTITLWRWLGVRDGYARRGERALFVGEQGKRIGRNAVYGLVTGYAERFGFHDPGSYCLEDRFSPNCFRQWLTSHLRKRGLSREFLKELKGESRGEAINVYDQIYLDKLRHAYLAAIPRLGII